MRSRRSFLKLAGAAAAGALLLPRRLPAGGGLYKPQGGPVLDQPWPQGPDVKLGRGTLGWGAPILSRPHPEGVNLGYVYTDEVVRVLREVVGLGMAFHTHLWFELEKGYVYAPYLQPVMNLLQTPLTTIPPDGVWTELVAPYVDARARPDPAAPKVYRIYYSSVFQVVEVAPGADGQPWYRLLMETQEIMWGPAQNFRVISADEISPLSPEVDPAEKRIAVYLVDQALSAFEGKREVFRTSISSGANYFGPDGHTLVNGTPGGEHPIWQKRISRHMQGGTVEAGYDVTGVGWVSYFSSNGAALHSTYWHNDFGIPKSHGCLNCRPEDAKWLFRWTAPGVAYDPGDITVDWDHRGTTVQLLEALMDPAKIGFGLAFLAGLASFLSPCVLSLVPAYVGYLSSRAVTTSGQVVANRWATLSHGAAFVLGFSVVFVTLGAAASAVGALLYDLQGWLTRIGGLVVIVFGLHTMGVIQIPLLDYDTRRQQAPDARLGYLSSALMGVFFSAGWAPCVGPVLGAVLTMALNADGVNRGVYLLCAYSLGLGIPFLLAAAGIANVSQWLRRYSRYLRYISIATGAFLIIIGIMLFTNTLSRFATIASFSQFQASIDQTVITFWQWLTHSGGSRMNGSPSRVSRASLFIVFAGLVVGAAVGLVAFAGWPGQLPWARPAPAKPSGPTATPAAAPITGAPAPDFTLRSLTGQPVTLSALRGQVVLINFWATWCIPCQAEMPAIQHAYHARKGDGFIVLAVNLNEPAKDVQDYVTRLGVNFPVLLDAGDTISTLYRVRGYPTSFFIDRGGTVAIEQVGMMSDTQLADHLAQFGLGD